MYEIRDKLLYFLLIPVLNNERIAKEKNLFFECLMDVNWSAESNF